MRQKPSGNGWALLFGDRRRGRGSDVGESPHGRRQGDASGAQGEAGGGRGGVRGRSVAVLSTSVSVNESRSARISGHDPAAERGDAVLHPHEGEEAARDWPRMVRRACEKSGGWRTLLEVRRCAPPSTSAEQSMASSGERSVLVCNTKIRRTWRPPACAIDDERSVSGVARKRR